MKFSKLTLYTHELQAEKEFYTQTLGLNLLQESLDSFTVQTGWTKITFKASDSTHLYHYCFLIPSNKLEEAMDWISSRHQILQPEGLPKFHHFENWNAHAFYFRDGSGNIVEFIARHDLQNQVETPFDQNQILGLNEIGMPVDDIELANERLGNTLNTSFWKGDLHRFGTHGDQDGIILLPNPKNKSEWFPTMEEIKKEPFDLEMSGNETHILRYKAGDFTLDKAL
ncbi:glyoxalase [bacterium]|nr:glyoxalase [bacterium]